MMKERGAREQLKVARKWDPLSCLLYIDARSASVSGCSSPSAVFLVSITYTPSRNPVSHQSASDALDR